MPGITLSGFNGIDFNSIITAVMQFESQPLQALQNEQATIQNKDAAFVSLGAMISALQAPVTSLTGASAFSNVSATSSNTSIATVSSSAEGSIGQYSMSITQLAKGQVTKSTNGYAALTDTAATGGSISFTINGTTSDPITITSATTLSDLKKQINDQNSGVIASIINDGSNFKLVISSRDTGATNGFTINNSLTNSTGAAAAFAAGQSPTSGNAQNAQNARLNVNGIDIESASNDVSDAIPGASINLLKEGDVTVSVTKDFSSIKDNLRTIVAQYNKLRQFYTQQTKGVLGGEPILRETLNDLKSALLTGNSNGGKFKYLSEIGLELTSTGDLKLDESKLDSVTASNPGDLAKLFQGATGSDGVFNALKSTLSNLDATSGLIKTARDSIQTTLTKYSDRLDRQQSMLDLRRQELTKMYAAADQAMSRMNQLTSMLSNLQRTI